MTQNKDRRHRRKGPLTPLQWVLTLSLGLVVLLITGCSVAPVSYTHLTLPTIRLV